MLVASMDGAAAPLRRPRPVADAPVAPLADGVAVAKSWLLVLLADAPLHQAAAIPMADLARGGPALCAAVLAAVRSDDDLNRLSGGDRAPLAACAGRLAGARGPTATAAAVEGLRRAVWHALLGELRDPHPDLVAGLGDRVAHVCSVVATASLSVPVVDPPGRAGPLAEALAAQQAPPAPATPPVDGVDGTGGNAMGPVPAPPLDAEAWDDESPEAVPAPGGATVTVLPGADRVWTPSAEPPWRGAIARRLERREDDGLPFAVLTVEVDDLERLLAAGSGRDVAFALEAAERGLTAELAPADVVVRERLGRWWLTSPDRDARAARDLGMRVGAAISHATLAGTPLQASIGVAVCPDDGADVESLAGRAEQGLYSARAAGLRLA
jgi:GGDEF domain-containing protein